MLRYLALATNANANAEAGDGAGGEANWMAPYQQEGWETKEVKNQVQNGEVTTYELGKPNYQILNPEDEPEFITEDQPHYQEWLRRLTSNGTASETIEVGGPSASSSVSASATEYEEPSPSKRPQWEKLWKRSHPEEAESSNKLEKQNETEVEAVPVDKKSLRPKVQIFAGAKPFQKLIANLS